MNQKTKLWLGIASCLVLVGGIIFGIAMVMLNGDFSKLSTDEYETNEHVIGEDYKNILIDTDTADIVFVPSESASSSVRCYEEKNAVHSVTVKDGTLVIAVTDTKKWYDHIGIFNSTPKITVSIPQGEYGTLSVESDTGDVEIPKEFKFSSIHISDSTGNIKNAASALEMISIKTSTGYIRVEDVSANTLALSVSTGGVTVSKATCEGDITINISTGKTQLSDIACNSLISNGNTGDISLDHVIAAEKFDIERSTGDVRFEGCDAAEIFAQTDTGDVVGSLLSDKIFMTQTDTGSVDVPKTVTGGKCEIETDTGDIKITIE